jgi:hypothetical protein
VKFTKGEMKSGSSSHFWYAGSADADTGLLGVNLSLLLLEPDGPGADGAGVPLLGGGGGGWLMCAPCCCCVTWFTECVMPL